MPRTFQKLYVCPAIAYLHFFADSQKAAVTRVSRGSQRHPFPASSDPGSALVLCSKGSEVLRCASSVCVVNSSHLGPDIDSIQ